MASLTLGLGAAPVHAQSAYDDDGAAPYETSGVTVYAPRTVGRSDIGAPIQEVRASRVVRFDDLDLDSRWGAHVLKVRIERAANQACDELDQDYPISDDSTPCRQTAVDHAMYQVREMTGYPVY